MKSRKIPIVAIIGRPNVGKSTLFNRIAGGRKAIVHDEPGVTRDRTYKKALWGEVEFMLVDTGGFDPDSSTWDVSMVTSQAEKALDEADAVIFLVDASAGLTPLDSDVARILRRRGRKIYLAVNKVDHYTREAQTADFDSLGFQPVYPISAEHGLGIGELLDAVCHNFPGGLAPEEGEAIPRIAVVGRPNVGKSTLVNYLVGEERSIAHHEPGTTRDAVDTLFILDGKEYELVDTAGIRRRGKIRAPVEKYSVIRAKKTIERSDICLLLIDAMEMVTEQDTKIAGLIQDAERGCVILINKWDLVESMDRGAAVKCVREAMPFMSHAPVVSISAKTGLGVHKIFPLVNRVHEGLNMTIPASELNRFLYEAVKAYKPASYHGRAVSFGYMTQAGINPPTFVVLTNEPARVHFTYRRYLVNRLREKFDFGPVPVIIKFRRKQKKTKSRGR